jgi:hypothetical protein
VVAHPIEPSGLLSQRLFAAMSDVIDETRSRGEGLIARGVGARDDGEELGRREHAAAEIDRAEHGSQATGRARTAPRAASGLQMVPSQ